MQISSISSISSAQIPASRPSDVGLNAVTGVPYTARVGGKTYSANIQQMENEFEAQVPSLLGVDVVAPTVEKVEDSLSNLINFFA